MLCIIQLDEAFFGFSMDAPYGWYSLRGEQIHYSYHGRHQYVTGYGAVSKDGRQLFRIGDKFDTDTFMEYFVAIKRIYGKFYVMMDSVSVHISRAVKKFAERNDIIINYIQTGVPEVNVTGETWH